jgi:hypothetical protein
MPKWEKVKSKDTEAMVEFFLYGWMMVGSTADIFVTSNVILLNDIAAFNNVDSIKIVVSIAGIKIISELDNYYAAWYISFMVKTTQDGFDMVKPQGYTTTKDGKGEFKTKRNDEFFHFRDLSILDLQAAAIWCKILLFWLVIKETFSFLHVFEQSWFAEITGKLWFQFIYEAW